MIGWMLAIGVAVAAQGNFSTRAALASSESPSAWRPGAPTVTDDQRRHNVPAKADATAASLSREWSGCIPRDP